MGKKRVLVIASWLLLYVFGLLGGTPKQVFAGERELVPPVPGDNGRIGLMGTTEDTIGVVWNSATDNLSSPENILYYVFLSKDHDLATLADCESFGILQNPGGTKNLTQYNITGLEASTSYYINIVIADQSGNRAAYNGRNIRTSLKLYPLTAGDEGKITLTPVDGQRALLQWAPVVSANPRPYKTEYYIFQTDDLAALESWSIEHVQLLEDVTSCYLDVPSAGTIYFTVVAVDEAYGSAYYQIRSRTFPNSLPVIRPGVNRSSRLELTVGSAYQVALDQLFTDPNGDALQYLVSVNGGAEQAASASYSYVPQSAGTTMLVFKASDYQGASTDTYTVTLAAKNPVIIAPEATPQPTQPQAPVIAFQAGSTFTASGYRYLVTRDDAEVRLTAYTGKRTSISIPSTVTRNGVVFRVTAIGYKAFYKKNITSVSIPDSITSVGKYAFENCRQLRSVSFGRNVSEIQTGAFYKTYSLQKLTFKGEKLPRITKKVFSGNSERISIKASSKIIKYSKTLKKVFKTAGISAFYSAASSSRPRSRLVAGLSA